MTVIRGVIREIGRSFTTRVGHGKWYGSTLIVVQDESSGSTYDVYLPATVLQRCEFFPRIGMGVIIHGLVEKAETGLSDFTVSHVSVFKHQNADLRRRIPLD
ncbi:MAG: hypothetical protein QXS20_08930 [Candidatus Thorarchaeota archaeon]